MIRLHYFQVAIYRYIYIEYKIDLMKWQNHCLITISLCMAIDSKFMIYICMGGSELYYIICTNTNTIRVSERERGKGKRENHFLGIVHIESIAALRRIIKRKNKSRHWIESKRHQFKTTQWSMTLPCMNTIVFSRDNTMFEF